MSVAQGGDDAYESQGAVRADQSSLNVGKGFLTGLRFRGVAVPPGARITSAVLTIYPAGRVDPITVRYRGELSVQATSFSNIANGLTQRPKTQSGVLDTPPAWVAGTKASSPNLASVIQDVISQPGWQSGNPLVLFIEDQGSAGSRRIMSAESGAATAASLRILYDTP